MFDSGDLQLPDQVTAIGDDIQYYQSAVGTSETICYKIAL